MKQDRKDLYNAWGIPLIGSIVARKCGSTGRFGYFACLQIHQKNRFKYYYLGKSTPNGYPRFGGCTKIKARVAKIKIELTGFTELA